MSDFTIPSDFGFEPRHLILTAMKAGWDFRLSGNGHAIGHAPDGVTTMSISKANTRNRNFKNALSTFRRWERIQREGQAGDHYESTDDYSNDALIVISAANQLGYASTMMPNGRTRLTNGHTSVTVHRDFTKKEARSATARLWANADPLAEAALRADMVALADERGIEVHEAFFQTLLEQAIIPVRQYGEVKPPKAKPESTPEPIDAVYVVSRKPRQALRSVNSGAAETYPSAAVDEIALSDGTVTYGCRECDFVNPKHRSVSVHYATTHSRGKGKQPVAESTDIVVLPADYEPGNHRTAQSEYRPTARLMEALMDALRELDWNTATHEDVALHALTWMRTRPDLPEPEPRVLAALTDAEVVARIRALVGAPATAEMVDRMGALEGENQRLREALSASGDAQAMVEKQKQAMIHLQAEIKKLSAEVKAQTERADACAEKYARLRQDYRAAVELFQSAALDDEEI